MAVVDSDTHDPNETNNKDNDTITVDSHADLAINKTVSPHYPKRGDVVVWTITVTNNGPDVAVNAYVRDVLPSGLEFIESDGNYTNNIWYIGNMANGSTAVLNIKTRILVTDAVITNVASVTSDTPDPDLTNNEDNATLDIGHEADLAVVKVVSNSTPNFGDIITWTITVTNNGPDRAIDIVVHDVLPSGLVYISDDSNGAYDAVKGLWTIGLLQNGASVTLNILSQVNITNATITNVAVVDSDTHDPNETNNKDNDTIIVPPQADLSIVKDVNTAQASIHDIIVWTVTLTNNGPDTAENIVVKEILPSGLKLLSVEAGAGSYSDGIWRIDSLNNGGVVTLKLVTEVTILNGTIINIVNVESSTYDPNKDNNNATAVVNIISNETESNETESNDTVIKESVSPSSPLALYPTANPFAIVILALLSIVFVRLRRIKL